MKFQAVLASVLGVAILGIAATASAQTEQNGFATVVRVQGLASYSLGDGQTHPLLAGKTLPAGATIYTGDNSVVDVVLGKQIDFPQSHGLPDRISPAADAPVRGLVSSQPASEQNVVRLSSGTTLSIDRLTTTDTYADTVSDTELNLKKGKIFASVKKLSPVSQYLVKIPNGVAGVRGTKFSIGADGGVAVYSSNQNEPQQGLVFSMSINNVTQTFVIAPGQMFDPATGQPVSIPPGLFTLLSNTFKALTSTYFIIGNFDLKFNNCNDNFTSPTSGSHH
jgi:hypothetical protein